MLLVIYLFDFKYKILFESFSNKENVSLYSITHAEKLEEKVIRARYYDFMLCVEMKV